MVGGIEPLVGRAFHGREAIRGFFDDFQASFGQWHIEVEQAIAAGERILLILNAAVVGRYCGEGKIDSVRPARSSSSRSA